VCDACFHEYLKFVCDKIDLKMDEMGHEAHYDQICEWVAENIDLVKGETQTIRAKRKRARKKKHERSVQQKGADRKYDGDFDAFDEQGAVDEDIPTAEVPNRTAGRQREKMKRVYKIYEGGSYEFMFVDETSNIEDWGEQESITFHKSLMLGSKIPASNYNPALAIFVDGEWHNYKTVGRGDDHVLVQLGSIVKGESAVEVVDLPTKGEARPDHTADAVICDRCKKVLKRESYSKTQWSKRESGATCKACVEIKLVEQVRPAQVKSSTSTGESKSSYSDYPDWTKKIGLINVKSKEGNWIFMMHFAIYSDNGRPVTFLFKHGPKQMGLVRPDVQFEFGNRKVEFAWKDLPIVCEHGDVIVLDGSKIDVGISHLKMPVADAVISQEICVLYTTKNTRVGKIDSAQMTKVKIADEVAPVIKYNISTNDGDCGLPLVTKVEGQWKFVGPHICGRVAGRPVNGVLHYSSLNCSAHCSKAGGGMS
jgi:hypothetical protein